MLPEIQTGLTRLFRKTWINWIIIAGITVIIYSGTLSFKILINYDDDAYFQDHRINELSTAHFGNYFSDYYLGMYQPLPVLSFAVLLKYFPGSAEAQRMANLLLHCLNALLVLILIRRLTGNYRVAVLTSLFFAIHPMHVESVAWIATRSNLMYSFFFLTSLILYVKWQEERRIWEWLLMFFCFIISLFCKVTAATFPLVVILLDWLSGKKFGRTTLLGYLPLILVSAVFIRIGIHASGAFGHITDLGQTYTFFDRIFILLHAMWLYLGKAILPLDQSVIYLYPWKEAGSLPVVYFITGILALLVSTAILFTGWKLRKRETGKIILSGFLFFLLTLCIVLPLKWSRTVLIAERYTYIPYIGIITGILMLSYNFAKAAGRMTRVFLWIVLTGVILAFSFISYNRTKVWKDPVSLFSDVIAKDRSGAEVSMGYYNRGNEYLRLQEPNLALSDYSQAIKVFPGYTEAYYNRGLVNFKIHDYQTAADDFSMAISLRNNFTQAYLNRGTVYRSMRKYPLALEDFNRAIEIQPSGVAYFSRGALLYFNFNEIDLGCDDWNESLRLGYEPARELLEKYCL